MRAAVVRGFGQQAVIEDRPIPRPGPDQVVVRMEASGHYLAPEASWVRRAGATLRSAKLTIAEGRRATARNRSGDLRYWGRLGSATEASIPGVIAPEWILEALERGLAGVTLFGPNITAG